jgi:hypothetical protein
MKQLRVLLGIGGVIMGSLAHAGLMIWGDGFMMTVQEPAGWTASSDAGRANGLSVVLFQKGNTWQNSPVVMYARLVKTTKDLSAFIAADVRDFQQSCPGIQISDVNSTEKRFVCKTGGAPNAELVHYTRTTLGIVAWVMSARLETDLDRYSSDFHKVVSSATCEAINTSSARGGKSR